MRPIPEETPIYSEFSRHGDVKIRTDSKRLNRSTSIYSSCVSAAKSSFSKWASGTGWLWQSDLGPSGLRIRIRRLLAALL